MRPPSSPASPRLAPAPPSSGSATALLRHFPPGIRDAFARFQQTGDPAAADAVVLAVVRDHIPNKMAIKADPFEDSAVLISGLGFDSMAITEMVFFIEDLFQVTIANEEIIRVRTVGDLRAFVRWKLSNRSTPRT